MPTWATLLPYAALSDAIRETWRDIGACAARALATGLGTDDVRLRATWAAANGNPEVTRQDTSFSQLAAGGGACRSSRVLC